MDVLYDLPGDAIYRTFTWEDDAGGSGVTFHVVTIPADGLSAALWFNEPGTTEEDAAGIVDVAEQTGAQVVINGGYFDEDFAPAGLAVRGGVELSPASDQAALSGFVSISESGQVRLSPSSDGMPAGQTILQSGPFLIDPGGTMGIRSDDGRRQRRSVIALGGEAGDTLVLILADAVSLYTLARLMFDHPSWFGVSSIDSALNLDGGPSSTLYIDVVPGQEVVPAHGPVQNFIVFGEY